MPRSTKASRATQERRAKTTQPLQAAPEPLPFERILVGVRLEQRLVKVLKGLAELKDQTFGELIEEITMTAMEGASAFADANGQVPAETRQKIRDLKRVYGVNYDLRELHSRAKSARGRKNRP